MIRSLKSQPTRVPSLITRKGQTLRRLAENQSARSGIDQIVRIMAVLLSLIALIVALVHFRISSKSKETARTLAVRSLAVLPFKTIGVEEGDDYLGLGMADALITRLGNLKAGERAPDECGSQLCRSGTGPVGRRP